MVHGILNTVGGMIMEIVMEDSCSYASVLSSLFANVLVANVGKTRNSQHLAIKSYLTEYKVAIHKATIAVLHTDAK